MGIFSFGKKAKKGFGTPKTGEMAELALRSIHEGIIILDKNGHILFINPAAMTITGCTNIEMAIGFDYNLIVKLVDKENVPIPAEQDKLAAAIKNNEAIVSREYAVASTTQAGKVTPVAITLTPTGEMSGDKILTMRNIEQELKEEGEQMEFISIASHEMRTPVASIEGYLGLALNPQTATIDDRARKFIEAAHNASKNLGRLFRDLLDVTKLDDGRLRPKLRPLDLQATLREMAQEMMPQVQAKQLGFSFGKRAVTSGARRLEQTVYTLADIDFLGDIFSNLVENAIKYTPSGGMVAVDVQGDGNRAIFSVSDNGIGIESDDLQYIFKKFYRVDNSQTRTIGGTGLGLYLVKQRVEAMNGRIWAESIFGRGSTFFVALPRLSANEYEKSNLAWQNQQTSQAFAEKMTGSGTFSTESIAPINTNQVLLPQTPVAQQPIAPQQPPMPQQPAAIPVRPQQPVQIPPQQIPPQQTPPVAPPPTQNPIQNG